MRASCGPAASWALGSAAAAGRRSASARVRSRVRRGRAAPARIGLRRAMSCLTVHCVSFRQQAGAGLSQHQGVGVVLRRCRPGTRRGSTPGRSSGSCGTSIGSRRTAGLERLQIALGQARSEKLGEPGVGSSGQIGGRPVRASMRRRVSTASSWQRGARRPSRARLEADRCGHGQEGGERSRVPLPFMPIHEAGRAGVLAFPAPTDHQRLEPGLQPGAGVAGTRRPSARRAICGRRRCRRRRPASCRLSGIWPGACAPSTSGQDAGRPLPAGRSRRRGRSSAVGLVMWLMKMARVRWRDAGPEVLDKGSACVVTGSGIGGWT